MSVIEPDLMTSQFQYRARLIASLISVLIRRNDHVTFHSWQSKCKSYSRRARLNASLDHNVRV